MPERDPGLITAIISAAYALQAFLYAALVAFVRIVRDGKEPAWKRIALEAFLCGLLAQGIDSGAKFFFDWHIPTFIAACVGLLGPEWIRKNLNKKVSQIMRDDDNENNPK